MRIELCVAFGSRTVGEYITKGLQGITRCKAQMCKADHMIASLGPNVLQKSDRLGLAMRFMRRRRSTAFCAVAQSNRQQNLPAVRSATAACFTPMIRY